MTYLASDLPNKEEINVCLKNWGRWCRGGWPKLGYSTPVINRECKDGRDWRDKKEPGPRPDIDVVSAEAANFAIVNLGVHGNFTSYQIIAAWWAHHQPAKQIAKTLHCSTRSVYHYRIHAMGLFWPEYLAVQELNRRKSMGLFDRLQN